MNTEKILDKIMYRTSSKKLKIGSKVKIHPQLTTDPYHERGKYGKIVGINKYGDYIIKFPDGIIGTYQNDTVLKVK